MKKVLLFLILLFIPFIVNADKNKMVKVYVFEAGGCPYCEAEIDYLKGLKSYNKKFTIEKKELYVDHIEWEPGKDYELGKKVADAFNSKGFTDASYHATPFVVISNLYATAGYSTDLESIINEAYNSGDKDVVGCFINKKDNCTDLIETTTTSNSDTYSSNSESHDYPNTSVIWTVITCTIILGSLYIIKSNSDREKILKSISK